jgi:zinc/manganese transport system substrate-binding protein
VNPRILSILLAATLVVPAAAQAKLRVAASTTDLASIAASVGGDAIEVFAIARPNADPHRVEALPSYMIKVARAQVYLKVGLSLDQWADAILDGSRNAQVLTVDCSQGVTALEKPTGKVDASMGDVHPNGNPHYWLDPRNGAIIARDIADGLARADAAHAADYHARAEAFAKECQAAYERGRAVAAKLPSRAIFTYHRSWPYFADAFGFDVVSTVEPVPGIPPTARHLAELVDLAKSRQVKLLIEEPYFASDAGRFLDRSAGVRAVIASSSCDDEKPGSYLAHIAAVLTDCEGGPAK